MLLKKEGKIMSTEIQPSYLASLTGNAIFSRSDLLSALQSQGISINMPSFKKLLQKLLSTGEIARAGRNAYFIPVANFADYQYSYSETASSIASRIAEEFPALEYVIFELQQLNEFVNHQIAHNAIFVYVPAETMDFVFDMLREEPYDTVLLNPGIDEYHKYWSDNMIVVKRLISESPPGRNIKWHSRVEKIMVDMIADKLLAAIVSPAELPRIYEDIFAKYIVDESSMFRYAKRRNSLGKIKQFIKENTRIRLRLDSK